MFTVQSLSGTGEEGVSRVGVGGELAFLGLTSFLIPFRCGRFYKASLQLSSCFPHPHPISLLSRLLHSSESTRPVYIWRVFFLTIDPQPSASINPASSVCSVRQTTPPPSPEFTLGLHFITDAEDNQYELGVWCQVKKHNLPEHTVLFVSTKDCWSYIYP